MDYYGSDAGARPGTGRSEKLTQDQQVFRCKVAEWVASFVVGSLTVACGGQTGGDSQGATSAGGNSAVTSTSTASGGAGANAGSANNSGGSSSETMGGALPTGGTHMNATGGSLSASGNVTTGGMRASGGVRTTGGSMPTGGKPAIGGSLAAGGSLASGGSRATGGTSADGQSLCLMPADSGPCKAAILEYFFNVETGRCEPFTYGGCEGNANRFDTLDACQKRCTPNQEYCPDKVPPVNVVYSCIGRSVCYYSSISSCRCVLTDGLFWCNETGCDLDAGNWIDLDASVLPDGGSNPNAARILACGCGSPGWSCIGLD
jgi:hypothetical protein